MKIEYTLLKNLILNNKIELLNELLLKEGSVFKGKIVEIKNNTAIINVPDYGTLEAILDIKYKLSENEQILFEVKYIDDSKIYLKPLLDDSQTNQSKNIKEKSVIKFLADLGMEKNENAITLVENLMSHNLPINKKVINEAVTILDKLIQILNLTDEKNISLSDLNLLKDVSLDVDKIDVSQIGIDNFDVNKLDINKLDIDIDKDNLSIEKSNIEKLDIRLLLISDTKSDNALENNISNEIKKYISSEIQFDNLEDLIKITCFLVRNNIKPTFKNLKYIKELDANPEEFFKDIQEIFKLAKFDNIFKIKSLTKDKILKMEIPYDLKIVTTQEQSLNELREVIKEVVKNSKEDSKMDELESRLNFLRELTNNELFLMFFPINYDFDEKLEGFMTFIKERKTKGLKDKLNILINLNTKNLGNVRALCIFLGDLLNIKMSIREEDLEFFKSNEKKLIEKLLTIGYSVKGIEYFTDKKISIMDTQTQKNISSYILDLKV